MLIPPFSLQTSNFCSPQNWEEWEGMGLGLMKFLLKPLNTPLISTILFSISHKKKNIATRYCLFATKWSYCCFVRHHWSYCCLFFDCCKFWLLLTSKSFFFLCFYRFCYVCFLLHVLSYIFYLCFVNNLFQIYEQIWGMYHCFYGLYCFGSKQYSYKESSTLGEGYSKNMLWVCVRNYFSLMSWDCGLRLIH